MLRALEVRRLVRRDAHPTDKRAWSLVATPAGRALANRANAAVEACDREFFAALEGEKPRFNAALVRLR